MGLKRFFITTNVLIFLSIIPNRGYCGFKDFCADLKRNFMDTFCSKSYDLYIPGYAFHNRYHYDDWKIDECYELAIGAGLGKAFIDEKKNWHGLYFILSPDCVRRLQTFFGYSYLMNWGTNLKVGIGFTLSFMQRSEFDYIPLPLPPLPLIEFAIKRVSLHITYVPGYKRNHSHILYAYLKIALDKSNDNN